jgi:hypothetical protein
LAPEFIKGYSRKGTLQYFMKDYEKALATYEAGMKHEPDNQELKDGLMRCLEAIDRLAHGEGGVRLMGVGDQGCRGSTGDGRGMGGWGGVEEKHREGGYER